MKFWTHSFFLERNDNNFGWITNSQIWIQIISLNLINIILVNYLFMFIDKYSISVISSYCYVKKIWKIYYFRLLILSSLFFIQYFKNVLINMFNMRTISINQHWKIFRGNTKFSLFYLNIYLSLIENQIK